MSGVAHIPKADMHVHLEGTIMPEMVVQLAAKNGIPLPENLFNPEKTGYVWPTDGTAASALVGFLHAYDIATSVIKTPDDYAAITYDYLMRAAKENCIYAEITTSADHAMQVGISYADMCDAVTRGYEKAKAETGIEMRMIPTVVRHYGPEKALEMAHVVAANPHPLATAVGLAGNENAYTVNDFKPAFEAMGLSFKTAHAGEAAGPDSVRAARDELGVRRFGHMVRAIEDPALMQQLKQINAVPEVCVSSNMTLSVYKNYGDHPLKKFVDFGFKVVLGSDDPPFFNTSIGREYQIAHEKFGLSDKDLLRITKNAIEEAFVDEPTRQRLLKKVADMSTFPKSKPGQKGFDR